MARLDGVLEVEERIKPKKSAPERMGKEEIWLLRKARR